MISGPYFLSLLRTRVCFIQVRGGLELLVCWLESAEDSVDLDKLATELSQTVSENK